jgi:predicted nucleic acid-binding protein
LSAPALETVRVQLEQRWAELDVIAIDDDLLHAAGEAAEAQRLRALDAVHLAAALRLGDPELVLVSWDLRLREAAQASGLAIAP